MEKTKCFKCKYLNVENNVCKKINVESRHILECSKFKKLKKSKFDPSALNARIDFLQKQIDELRPVKGSKDSEYVFLEYLKKKLAEHEWIFKETKNNYSQTASLEIRKILAKYKDIQN